VLYVFEAEPWTHSRMPKHGQLVRLLDPPVGRLVVSQATRLAAQRAALLYADVISRTDVNLAGFLRCVLVFADDFAYDSIPGVQRSSTSLFPEPSEDPFYRHLIAFPGAVTFECGSGQLAHPLDLARYLDSAEVPPEALDGPTALECRQLVGKYCLKCRLMTEKVELSDPLFHRFLSGEGETLFEDTGVEVKEPDFLAFGRALVALEWAKAGQAEDAIRLARDAADAAAAAGFEIIQKVMALFENLARDVPAPHAVAMLSAMLNDAESSTAPDAN
jgi:hypothetical protein